MSASTGAAHALTKVALADQIGAWVARATPGEAVPASTPVDIAVHLAFKPGLDAFVASVSNPRAASYGKYLSAQTFAAKFAPAAADAAAVRDYLVAQGLTNVTIGAGNAYVSASTTAGKVASAFGVTQRLYRFEGRSLRAAAEAPSVPATLAAKIVYIEGLDDSGYLRQPHHKTLGAVEAAAAETPPASVIATSGANAVTPLPTAGSVPSLACSRYYGDTTATLSTAPAPYPATLPWLVCGYSPAQVRAAYGLDKTSLDGTGITVAVVDAYASPTLFTDLQRYAKRHGLKPITQANYSQIVAPDAYKVVPAEVANAYGWWGEQHLDVAAVHATAPGAKIVYVGAKDNRAPLTVALAETILNRRADVITNSYGYTGDYYFPTSTRVAFDNLMLAAASMGTTVLFSSGDNGDNANDLEIGNASWEATSNFVTAVGGTSLGLTDSTGNKTEWGWGTYRAFFDRTATSVTPTAITTSGFETVVTDGVTYPAFSWYSGSGGGVSLIEPQPFYQAGVVPDPLATTVHFYADGSTIDVPTLQEIIGIPIFAKGRVSPDISMVADPYTGFLYGESFRFSATPYNNTNGDGSPCTVTGADTQYCEGSIGGTSLSSPLFAGMIAVVNQARKTARKPLVGFANPWIYGLRAQLYQVRPPATPTAMLRGYVPEYRSGPYTGSSVVRLITVNSAPRLTINTTPAADPTMPPPPPSFLPVCLDPVICEGLGGFFIKVTNAPYNDVTGVGVPDVRTLLKN